MRNPIFLTLALLASLTVFGLSTIAQPPGGEGRPFPPSPGHQPPPEDRGEILRQLNLTPEQFRSVAELVRENQPKIRQANMAFMDIQDELDEAIYADVVDETLVQALTRRAADAHAAVIKARTSHEFAIRRVLRPEQISKFRELRKEQVLRKMVQERMRQNREEGLRPDGQPRRGQRPPGEDRPAARPLGQPANNIVPDQNKRKP